MAGLNAARAAGGHGSLIILDRATAYIGVMIDDLVTKGVSEPYRTCSPQRPNTGFPCEPDNDADQRLTALGEKAGIVGLQNGLPGLCQQRWRISWLFHVKQWPA